MARYTVCREILRKTGNMVLRRNHLSKSQEFLLPSENLRTHPPFPVGHGHPQYTPKPMFTFSSKGGLINIFYSYQIQLWVQYRTLISTALRDTVALRKVTLN